MCVRRHSAAQGRPTRCKADFRLDLDSACAKGDFEWRCRSCDSYCCSIEQLIGCGPSLRPWAVPLLGDRGDFERAGNVATGRSGRKIRTPTKRHAPRATIPRLAATGPRSRFSRVRRRGAAAIPRRPRGPPPRRTGSGPTGGFATRRRAVCRWLALRGPAKFSCMDHAQHATVVPVDVSTMVDMSADRAVGWP